MNDIIVFVFQIEIQDSKTAFYFAVVIKYFTLLHVKNIPEAVIVLSI